MLGYEWTHYLMHSDYRPQYAVRTGRCGATTGCTTTRTSTTGSRSPPPATADRLFGTYPDPASAETSPTAKNLHGG